MAEAIILAAAEEARNRRLSRLYRRTLRSMIKPVLSDQEFVGHFRLNKATFETLCEEVIPLLPPSSQRSSAVPPDIKILAALAFYANGCYQKNVGAYHQLALSQPTVSECLRDVTEALNHRSMQVKYIRFPTSTVERENIAKRFMEKYGFPGVVGCIDGTHVAIIRPSIAEECYFNRKMYHSLNVLIICDAVMRILHVDASFGGQSHDSHVWNASPVRAYMEEVNEEEVCWFLGDSGYAQRQWLMTPILNTEPNTPEEHYTKMHVRTRNVVERCIGVLKTRFRCLLAHRVMHYDPVKAGIIVNACVVLYNFLYDHTTTAFNEIDVEEMLQDSSLQPAATASVQPIDRQLIDRGRQAVVDRLWRSRHNNIASPDDAS